MKLKIIIVLCLAGLSFAVAGQTDKSNNYTSVGPEDFLTLLRFKEGVVLIDVRLPFEYRRGHVEKSINIPLRLNPRNFIRKISTIPRDQTVLLYCDSDVRSISAAKRMYDEGFRSIYVLEGGIAAWQRKHLPLEKGHSRKKNP